MLTFQLRCDVLYGMAQIGEDYNNNLPKRIYVERMHGITGRRRLAGEQPIGFQMMANVRRVNNRHNKHGGRSSAGPHIVIF